MAERERLLRFSRTERALHWVHASAFLILLATGLALYFPSLAELVGRRPLLKNIHVYTAAAWAAAIVLVVMLGDRRSLRQTMREVDVFDRDDREWLRRRQAPQGRFNAGQKLNAAITAAFAVLFAVTGTLLWLGERDTRFRFAQTILIHDWLTQISLVLFVGHLYLAVIHPSTRHALNGMTRGWVDAEWADRHHAKWSRSTPVSPRREYGGLLPTIGGSLATKKQKARAAAAGKEPTGKPKPKKKTSRGK